MCRLRRVECHQRGRNRGAPTDVRRRLPGLLQAERAGDRIRHRVRRILHNRVIGVSCPRTPRAFLSAFSAIQAFVSLEQTSKARNAEGAENRDAEFAEKIKPRYSLAFLYQAQP